MKKLFLSLLSTGLIAFSSFADTQEKIRGVGTITFKDNGRIYIRKTETAKQKILNGDMSVLQKLNEATGQRGVYYRAVIYKGNVRNPRTGKIKTIDKVKFERVNSPKEVGIIDIRQSVVY